MTAVAVPGQVDAEHAELVAEPGGHVRPPVGVGAAAVNEDQAALAGPAARQGVDRAPVHRHLDVVLSDGQCATEPLRGVGQRPMLLHPEIRAHRGHPNGAQALSAHDVWAPTAARSS